MRTVNGSQLTVHGIRKNVSQLSTVNCRRFRAGFTILELTVVIGLLMLAIGSTLAVLVNTLKGSNQANVTSEVKQNGQAILGSLERQIRSARSIECKDSDGVVTACDSGSVSTKYLKLLRQNQNPLHIKCIAPISSANGYIGTVVSLTDPISDSEYTSISNLDTVSGVSVTSCTMSVQIATSGNVSPPSVNIDLTIDQGVLAPSRQDFVASAQFRTTISLRQY